MFADDLASEGQVTKKMSAFYSLKIVERSEAISSFCFILLIHFQQNKKGPLISHFY
jgi:hypothetical protein